MRACSYISTCVLRRRFKHFSDKKWFTQKNFILVRSIERLLIESANGKHVALSEEIVFDMQKLNLHLQVLPEAIKSVSLDGIPIKQVTRVQMM